MFRLFDVALNTSATASATAVASAFSEALIVLWPHTHSTTAQNAAARYLIIHEQQWQRWPRT